MNNPWESRQRILETDGRRLSVYTARDGQVQTVTLWLRGEATAKMHSEIAAILQGELQRCQTLRLVFHDVAYISQACLNEIVTSQINLADKVHKQIELVNVPPQRLAELQKQGIDQQLPIVEIELQAPLAELALARPADGTAPRQPAVGNTTVVILDCSHQWIGFTDQSQLTVGRSESNAIVIPAQRRSVSREHLKIYKENDVWYLVDLGATYRTALNGQLLAPNEATPIGEAARLKMGKEPECHLLVEPLLTVAESDFAAFVYQWHTVACLRSLAARQSVYLTDAPMKLGRGYAIGTMMTTVGIGRTHGEIFFRDGRFLIVDSQSTNGTFVNEAKIPSGEPFVLSDGDTIRLGGEKLGESYLWQQQTLNSEG